jgi:hypothetical protein
VNDVIKAYALTLDPATNTMMLNETPVSEGTSISGFPGEVQSVSADGTSNGIVWSADVDQSASDGPAILTAYNANDLSTPLYSSNQAGPRDTAGGGVKFSTPTIANGHVYLGTQSEVDVYGLLPQAGTASRSAGTVLTREPRVLAAATSAGPAKMRIARAAAPRIVAPNSGPRATSGDRPLVTRSGNEATTVHDLAISQLDTRPGSAPTSLTTSGP